MKNIKDKIKLKIMKESYITQKWVNWLNDKDVVKYSAQRLNKHTLKTQTNFIKKMIKNRNIRLYAIFYNNSHIGNIELKSKNNFNYSAQLMYLIGNKKLWGKSITTISIKKILKIGFGTFKLKKIYASTYIKNIASQKVLIKNNFKYYNSTSIYSKHEKKKVKIHNYQIINKNN